MIAITLVFARLRESFGPKAALDIPGLVTVAGAALALVWGLVRGNLMGWASLEVMSALGAGALLAALFVTWEMRARAPMMPMRLFHAPAFSASVAASFLFYAAMYGVLFLLPQFLQTTLGFGPLGAGLRLLPWTATLFVTAPVAGAVVNKFGERLLVATGLTMQAIGLGWMAMLAAPGIAYSALVAPLVLAGNRRVDGDAGGAECDPWLGRADRNRQGVRCLQHGALSRRHVRHRYDGGGVLGAGRGRFGDKFQRRLCPGGDGCGSLVVARRVRGPGASGTSARSFHTGNAEGLRSIAIGLRYRPIGKRLLVRAPQWIHNRTDADTWNQRRRPMTTATAKLHRVVIVGAGFGGLQATFGLRGAPVSITLIDRRNHHLFQPLLYQVATASLATSEIAWPIRYLLRDRPEVTTLFATVTGVDPNNKQVLLEDGDAVPYDTLILATGVRHAYFGHDEWEPFAPGLKTLEDATTLRRRILVAFERAERETDPARRAALLTFVIVGAGPTGVELAGTIAELAQDTLPPDFRNIDTHKSRVVLIEAGPRVLAGFADDLSAYAQAALEKIGVEVILGQPVTECTADGVMYGGQTLQAKTLIWAAGVRASPAAEWLGAPADRAGRLQVEPDLTVPGHPDIFAVGDTVMIAGPDGNPVPGIAPAAKQQGRYVAETIKARLRGSTAPPFRYKHAGSLAQIGKRQAVIDFGRFKLRGTLAWWIWGLAHIYFLIGLRNRLSVALSWLWIHARDQRAARLITQGSSKVVR